MSYERFATRITRFWAEARELFRAIGMKPKLFVVCPVCKKIFASYYACTKHMLDYHSNA